MLLNVVQLSPIYYQHSNLYPKRVVVWYNGFKYQINERWLDIILENVDSRLSWTEPCWRVMKSLHNPNFAMHFVEIHFAPRSISLFQLYSTRFLWFLYHFSLSLQFIPQFIVLIPLFHKSSSPKIPNLKFNYHFREVNLLILENCY